MMKILNFKNIPAIVVCVISLLMMLTACKKKNLSITEPSFKLQTNRALKYDYFYNFDETEEWPVKELALQIVGDIEIDNKTYFGFSNLSEEKPDFDLHNESNVLEFNFLPIRYENGNYYERRAGYEVVILKDNMEKGDLWKIEFAANDVISNYTFELIEIFEVYNQFGIEYTNVFQIEETYSNPLANGEQISTHYYNKEKGIIRREIPEYISGTYGPIVFNRIQ